MPNLIAEQFYSGQFLVSEGCAGRSRDAGLIQNPSSSVLSLPAGLVVSQNGGGTATIAATAGNVGNGTSSGVTVEPGAIFGEYSLTATNSTTFAVTDPNGRPLPALTVGTIYSGPIALTISAGGVAFEVGDDFTVDVTATIGAWISWTGGTFTNLGILFDRVQVNPGSQRKVSIVTREAEVNQLEVQFDPAVIAAPNAATLIAAAYAQLASVKIIARQL